ncbi:MAG TPA: glycine/sarcosine/betaine reductase component B subunit [candidate division Zixibacteria bacterium]|nr:glycine/sarcosine/betaine reductase component B subunit [candidate division Zixibacteria bacterium]
MRLELADYPVHEIRRGKRFHYAAGVLEIDEGALESTLLGDERLERASLAVVRPGERVRITGIRDVVEPRVKVSGSGQVFPGILGPVEGVGAGRTHRLSGMAVTAAAAYEGTVRAGLGVQRSALLDMWGPGAESSKFGRLLHLVLIMRLRERLSELDAHAAIQRAELEVARRLAEATIGAKPAGVEIFDLSERRAGLPNVALIQGCLTDDHNPHSGVSYYGMPIRESLATLVHPNELLDGAVAVNATRCIAYFPVTWDWQNHPLMLRLCREHGRRLNFAGMILQRIRYETFHGKEVIAHNAAQLAAATGADGALVAWLGSGNAFVDVMLTLRACERLGIRTVLVTYEYGGKDGIDSPLLFYLPEADATVSTGSRDRWLELDEAERVVGPYEEVRILSYPGAPVADARGRLTLDARDMIVGGVDNWGGEKWICKAY